MAGAEKGKGLRAATPATPTLPASGEGAEFASQAQQVVAWIAAYLNDPGRYPVLSQVQPGDISRSLPAAPPREAETFADILADVDALIMPGITHWNHPGFLAYFANSSTTPGILGELLTAALNVNGMLWKTSPSVTELEETTLDWLRQMLGLREGWFGMITDTASTSTLLALAAAREAKEELGVREQGMAGRPEVPVMRVYASTQAHSSVAKAAITLGFGRQNVVLVPADDDFRMDAQRLSAAIRDDRAAGYLPLAAVATVGTTSTTSVDPVRAIAEICRREGVWLHVDSAYAGVAAILPELRHVLDGVDSADSLVVNPHKWLLTPVDLSAFYTRHPAVLKRAFSLVPEFLVTEHGEDAVNYMDYGIQLGRRFRALKLWMVIRSYGVDGLARIIRRHIALAQELSAWIREEDGWEQLAPALFSTVCFRYAPAGVDETTLNRWNRAIMERVNASGEVYLSHTVLRERFCLRIAIGNIRTEHGHIARAWELLRDAARMTTTEEDPTTGS